MKKTAKRFLKADLIKGNAESIETMYPKAFNAIIEIMEEYADLKNKELKEEVYELRKQTSMFKLSADEMGLCLSKVSNCFDVLNFKGYDLSKEIQQALSNYQSLNK